MPTAWWKKGAKSIGLRTPSCPRQHHRSRFQPQAEALEDRMLLSAGAIDPTFGHDGSSMTLANGYDARAVLVEGDNKIVVLGEGQGFTNFEILRFNSDGSPDTNFGEVGSITGTWGGFETQAVNLAVLGNGSIVVAGSHCEVTPTTGLVASYFDVAEYLYDGTSAGTFGNEGLSEFAFDGAGRSAATDMAVGTNGRIVMAASTATGLAVLRLNADGSEDTSFGGTGLVTTALGTPTKASGLAIQSDNKIVVTGFSSGALAVLRYNADGSMDAAFGTNGIVRAAVVAGQTSLAGARVAIEGSDGKLVVSADYVTVTQHSAPWYDGTINTWNEPISTFVLYRFDTDGSADSSFGNDGQVAAPSEDFFGLPYAPTFHTLALQDDGKILVAGARYYSTAFVTRYHADGSLDLTYGNGGTAATESWWYYNSEGSAALAIQGDGKVIMASTASVWRDNVSQSVVSLTRFQADSDSRPAKFGSDAALKEYLIEQAVLQYQWEFGQVYPFWNYWYRGQIMAYAGGILQTPVFATASVDTAAVGNKFSTTNNQVQGVDEGDTVKTDGQYLYVLSNNNLVILNAWPADQLRPCPRRRPMAMPSRSTLAAIALR